MRIALGAGTWDVLRLVVGGAARLTLVGVALGLGTTAIASRWLAALISPVKPLDPATFVSVGVVLAVTAAIAAAAPALRAIRVDPVVTFRND